MRLSMTFYYVLPARLLSHKMEMKFFKKGKYIQYNNYEKYYFSV